MSSTGRSDCRQIDDFYATPAKLTKVILSRVKTNTDSPFLVLDPSCGKGAILDEVKRYWPHVVTYGFEKDPERALIARNKGHIVECCDSLQKDWRFAHIIIQNPPFNDAMAHLEKAISSVPIVASLHRQGLLCSQTRSLFWAKHRAFLHFLSKRPSFAVTLRCKQCKWAESFELDKELPTYCPSCGSANLGSTRTDSCDYAWFRFGGVEQNGWEIIQPSEL